jgi:hypothetical protein
MTRGTVKFYKEDKGYGAIASPDLPDGFDAWVHFSAIEGDGYRSLEVAPWWTSTTSRPGRIASVSGRPASASCNDRRELADQRSEIQIFDAASVNPVRR